MRTQTNVFPAKTYSRFAWHFTLVFNTFPLMQLSTKKNVVKSAAPSTRPMQLLLVEPSAAPACSARARLFPLPWWERVRVRGRTTFDVQQSTNVVNACGALVQEPVSLDHASPSPRPSPGGRGGSCAGAPLTAPYSSFIVHRSSFLRLLLRARRPKGVLLLSAHVSINSPDFPERIFQHGHSETQMRRSPSAQNSSSIRKADLQFASCGSCCGKGLPTLPHIRPQVSSGCALPGRPSVSTVKRSGDRFTTGPVRRSTHCRMARCYPRCVKWPVRIGSGKLGSNVDFQKQLERRG
jgi:hypothetical protein